MMAGDHPKARSINPPVNLSGKEYAPVMYHGDNDLAHSWRGGRRSAQLGAALLVLMLFAGCAKTQPQHHESDPWWTRTPQRSYSQEDQMRRRLLAEVQHWQGAPYRLGGTSVRGVDCSGLVMEIYKRVFGVRLPRTVKHQVQTGAAVGLADLKAGDLVFFRPSEKWLHVGVYVGDGRFFHASSSQGATLSYLEDPYWQQHYWIARRLVRSSAP